MASLAPKSPVPMLLLAGGVLWMLTRRRAAAATTNGTARAPVVVSSAPLYADPSAVAQNFGKLVQAFVLKRPVTPTQDPAATVVNETARNAVRAGDDYYGSGSFAWYTNNSEAAREAVRQGDAYYSGWSSARVTAVDTVTARSPEVDQVIAAPVYDPAQDADMWAGLIPGL